MFCHACGTQVADAARFCPSCGQALGMAPPAPGPLSSNVPPAPWTLRAGIQAQPGRWVAAGWNLVTADLGNYLLVSLIFCLLNGVPLIQGALIAGFHVFTMKKLMGRRAELGDLFKGFNFFVATLVASLLIGLFTFCGTLFLIIPGLVIAAMYKFTYLFIVDKRMDFWPAMQASHAVTRNDYFGFTAFLVLLFLVNVVGFLCLLVGLLVTIPVTFAAITVAYQEVVGFEPRSADAL
jgi:zinc-ribbon domain